MSEEFIIREINFPVIPEDIPESLKNYLVEMENALQESMAGSLFMEKVLRDGIFGN